jgi:predicted nucleotidyltransferase
MSSIVQNLHKRGMLNNPPEYVTNLIMYETIMGSESYGVNEDTSDRDVYGFCLPSKTILFPHLSGEINGFGLRNRERFEQFQQHHIEDKSSNTVYDVTVYNIVKYFQLLMENNPNMIDSIFTPRRCVLHSTKISEMVRDARREFLHKGCWHKFKGYAYAQLSKIKNKTNSTNEKRAAWIEKFGYDVKFAYHVVRLMNECEQILMTGDLNLEQNREQLKAIRRGEWTLEQLDNWAEDKHRQLENLYHTSTLQHSPDEDRLRDLLMNCIEEHYGSISAVVTRNDSVGNLIVDIDKLLAKYR